MSRIKASLSAEWPATFWAAVRSNPPAMTELGLGVATLEHEPTGRTDPDAVDATLAASGDASAFERLYRTHVPQGVRAGSPHAQR